MIDNNEQMMYATGKYSGYVEGFDDCKIILMEVIQSLAYEVAKYEYPN